MAPVSSDSVTLQKLPVDRIRSTIVDKVLRSRVTLIIGNTGCGKSTRVPQFLQQELKGKVICSQPRRLAVVSVAKRVAEETGSQLGAFVGYRIGQRSVAGSSTRLLFTTAGLLLEDVRANGAAALADCKCVVFDEVHERSVESDLALECLHQLMLKSKAPALRNLHLVLMSATADIDSFRRHFADLEPRLDVINISDSQSMLRGVMEQYEVEQRYLHHAVEAVAKTATPEDNERYHILLEAHKKMQQNPAEQNPALQVGPDMLRLAADLVWALHLEHGSAAEAHLVMLIFLPTYRSLEEMYQCLRARGAGELDVYALHSTLDTEECVRNLEHCSTAQQQQQQQQQGVAVKRKVIIATGVAESSITIPGVAWVIDTCVTNEVTWSEKQHAEKAHVVWASGSQCRQRQGRTGRTGRGTVYRLLPRNAFLNLPKFERPAMLLRPLRREALALMSGADKLLRDVEALFKRCMDPPPDEVVSGALQHLQDINAVEVVGDKTQASAYGRLLASMPVSLDAAILVVRGGQVQREWGWDESALGLDEEGMARAGLLWEAAVLAATCCTTPYPIKQPFGHADANCYVRRYCKLGGAKAGSGGVSDSCRWLANLAAYEFWQRCWCDARRGAALHGTPLSEELRRFVAAAAPAPNGAGAGWAVETALDAHVADEPAVASRSRTPSAPEMREAERRWCEAHYLVLPALLSITDTVAAVLAAVHKLRPVFLSYSPAPAEYFTHPGCERHVCALETSPAPLGDGVAAGTGPEAAPKCSRAGDVRFETLHGGEVRAALVQLLEPLQRGGAAAAATTLCRSVSSGAGCRFGDSCHFAHSAEEARDNARWRAQDFGQVYVPFEAPSDAAVAALAARIHSPSDGDACLAPGDKVVSIGDGDLSFSASLAAMLPPGAVIATSVLTPQQLPLVHASAREQLDKLAAHGAEVAYGVDARALDRGEAGALPWRDVRHVLWNFPHSGLDEDPEGCRALLSGFFGSAARRAAAAGFGPRGAPDLHLTLCNDQFGRWGLEAVARDAFWFVVRSEPLKEEDYDGYVPRRCTEAAVQRAEAAAAAAAAAENGGGGVHARGRRRAVPAGDPGGADVEDGDDRFEPREAITYCLRLVWPLG